MQTTSQATGREKLALAAASANAMLSVMAASASHTVATVAARQNDTGMNYAIISQQACSKSGCDKGRGGRMGRE